MPDHIAQTDSRRAFLRLALLGAAAGASATIAGNAVAAMTPPRDLKGDGPGKYRERTVSSAGHQIYVRDYPGAGPAFVMVHGFPDNCRIYEELAPLLSQAGRRVVVFDFLGFGSSDKPHGFPYTFAQQQADLEAVVADLGDAKIVPVAHDAGAPSVINFALDHPAKVSSLVLLNCYYAASPALKFPEFIAICADPQLRALGTAMMTDPKEAGWLLHFTQDRFEAGAPPAQRAKFDAVLQPIINDNFAKQPGSGEAFLAMAADAVANLTSNAKRLPALREFAPPVKLIWGVKDPYLTKALADDIASHFVKASVTSVEANHWPQVDEPEQVARAMLRRD